MFYFTPLPGFFSPFHRCTCSLSVASQYLALPDGPGRFVQDFSCPVLLGILLRFRTFRVPDYHRLWCTFPGVFCYVHPILLWSPATPTRLASNWFRLFPVHSPLLRESLVCFIFLRVLRCFSSPT